jgi:hypothetical protein
VYPSSLSVRVRTMFAMLPAARKPKRILEISA